MEIPRSYVALGNLVEALSSVDPTHPVRYGFGAPMSYRGCYDEVAFGPVDNTTVGEMLRHARAALGATFQGYKGGDFKMEEHTQCWIAEYGQSGAQQIGRTLLQYWLDGAAGGGRDGR